MIKFETINRTLCRMVEPEPLQLDSPMPCVVRLIQDSLTGIKMIVEYIGGKGNMFLRTDHVNICKHLGSHYAAFEIIGYPEEEGSKEWALYQIRSGKKVVKEGDGKLYSGSFYKNRLFYLNGYGCLVTENARGFIDPCSEEEFLDLDKTGWQIYKEPELHEVLQPKYRVGDYVICEYHRSPLPKQISYERVIDVDDVTVVTQSQNGSVCEYDINGNHGDINGWHIDRVISPCEHIVTIGCLSGTIGKSSDTDRFLMWHSSPKIDFDYSIIKFSALDKETSELVESLLKAQEEEK